jgi:pimeloyl-ACP methyl ester carboxylesterase
MTAIHDALRRDLDELLDTTASQARAQACWAVFRDQKDFRLAAEQAVMWLPSRAWLAGDPRARALLDAMDDERGLIGPLRAVTDDAFTMGADPGRLRQLLVRLRTKLASHLAHEEAEALPLISDAVSPGELSRITRALRGGYRARSAARTIPWAPEHGRRLAVLLPQAQLIEIEDSYTLIPLDQPARLAQLIADFTRPPASTTPSRPDQPRR